MNNLLKGNVLSAQCPARDILRHITSRWGGLVLLVLKTGTKRFGELKKDIEGISERMLTQTLQQLEQDGMIYRQTISTMPPHVEYSLTTFGQQAADKVANLVEWLEENLAQILATQQHIKQQNSANHF